MVGQATGVEVWSFLQPKASCPTTDFCLPITYHPLQGFMLIVSRIFRGCPQRTQVAVLASSSEKVAGGVKPVLHAPAIDFVSPGALLWKVSSEFGKLAPE